MTNEEQPRDEEVDACIQLILKMFNSYKIKRSVGINAMLSIFGHEIAGRETQMMEENLCDLCMHIRRMHKVKEVENVMEKLTDKINKYFGLDIDDE